MNVFVRISIPVIITITLNACTQTSIQHQGFTKISTGANTITKHRKAINDENKRVFQQIAKARKALKETASYTASVLVSESGKARMDYDIISSTWLEYEPLWHTGQIIWGLVEAAKVLDAPEYLSAATKAGNWWISTEFQKPHPFAGVVNAMHGDKLGDLMNWTTISDGTPGLFALSQATGNSDYANTATRSGKWLWDNTQVPAHIEGGEGLFYNIFDPKRGLVVTDWNPHRQGKHYDSDAARPSGPPPIKELARPNIEGFLFADMCRHSGDKTWCRRFLEQAEHTLKRQSENGLWMDFEPNNPETGGVHPRFNIWNAEALLEAYEISKDQKFLDGAVKTARFFRDIAAKDGTLYYKLNASGSFKTDSVTGSAVAFNGILMLRLRDYGYDEFDKAIKRSANWLIKNRYTSSHPDTNLAGAVINTRYRRIKGKTRIVNRDVGSSFGLRFLALHIRSMRGENINTYLRQ